MDHLEIKGFNWGVGYQDYHGPRSHAYLVDYWTMLSRYLDFHEDNAEDYLPHDRKPRHRTGEHPQQWGWTSADWDEDEEFRAYLRRLDRDHNDRDHADDDDLASEDFADVNGALLAEFQQEEEGAER